MTRQKEDLEKNRAAQKCLSATGALAIGALVQCMPAQAEGAALPIQSISVDTDHRLVVKFQGGGFPTVPSVTESPGLDHRVVFDFANATIDKGTMPSSQAVTSSVSAQLPGITNVRFSEVLNAEKPTARVVLHMPQAVGVTPRVVKVEEGQVVINLGDDVINAPTQALQTNTAANAVLIAQTQPGAPQVVQEEATEAIPSATVPGAPPPQGVGLNHAKVISSDLDATKQAPSNYDQAYEQMIKQKEIESQSPANAVWDKAVGATAPVIAPPAGADKSGGWDWTAGGAAAAGNFKGANTLTEPKIIPVDPNAPLNPLAPLANAKPIPVTADTQPVQVTPAAQTAPAAAGADLKPAISEDVPSATQAAEATAPAETKVAPSQKDAVKLFNQAVNFHLTGKLGDAIEAYKGAIAANPDLAQAHSNLGLIYNQQHNYAGALTEFRKALAINPKDAITYNGIGAALRAERDLMGAVKNWQTAVSLDPSLATAHYNLGTAYEIQKELDKALDSYQQAVKNDYRLGEAYYRMGLIMTRKNRPEEAAEKFTQALKISSKSEYSEDARQRLASLTQKKVVK